MTRRVPLGAWWILLAIVLAAALTVGSFKPGPVRSAAQRVAAIDAAVRCPSCEGVSVAQSSAPAALAIRTAVTARVAAGQSDAEIEAFLVGRYGEGILLRPPAGGGIGLVWVLPVLALLAG
ncbi:MAG: cytochrome c-type biogenesis protein, partial [Acidimicrobiales bacterium]